MRARIGRIHANSKQLKEMHHRARSYHFKFQRRTKGCLKERDHSETWTSASRRAGKHVLGERAGASQLPATQLPALPLLSGTEEVSSKQQQTYPLFQGFCTGP